MKPAVFAAGQEKAARPEHAQRLRTVVRRERVDRQRARARIPHAHRAVAVADDGLALLDRVLVPSTTEDMAN